MPLLEVDNLRAYFHTRNGIVRAVDGLSYTVEPGETLGIVGESGSGKSVSQYALLGLIPMPPGRIEAGKAMFQGQDLLQAAPGQLRNIRGKRISMIFQDPMTALNPYMKIGSQIMEPLLLHERCGRAEARRRAIEAQELVGIQDAPSRLNMYPHEFSGGMRQRVMIAMALITRPDLLIADEPTTALDVTVQAQILDLIKKAQRELGMAVTLITHDLGVIARTCDRVLVMYAGRILEAARTSALYYEPRHPYTHALMASMPSVHAPGESLYTIPGLPPDLSAPIQGCPFAPRCGFAADKCHTAACPLELVAPEHSSACIRVQAGEIELPGRGTTLKVP
ncbi:MAG: ABC transporter ATP-binding protein [Candidatus Hydrogenedentes bacterium]|nr:ABC transporter ATP-binding protein [Candidatus Hydrogenedentota bacterium]